MVTLSSHVMISPKAQNESKMMLCQQAYLVVHPLGDMPQQHSSYTMADW